MFHHVTCFFSETPRNFLGGEEEQPLDEGSAVVGNRLLILIFTCSGVRTLPVFQVLLQDDQGNSQEKEKDR